MSISSFRQNSYFTFRTGVLLSILLHILILIMIKYSPSMKFKPPLTKQKSYKFTFVENKQPPSNNNLQEPKMSDIDRKALPGESPKLAQLPQPNIQQQPLPPQKPQKKEIPQPPKPTVPPQQPTPKPEPKPKHHPRAGSVPIPRAQHTPVQAVEPSEPQSQQSYQSSNPLQALRRLRDFLPEEKEGGTTDGQSNSSIFFDTKGFDFGPYADKVVRKVRENWFVPMNAYLGMKGVVHFRFYIHRDGSISELQMVESSGIGAYDRSARLAVTGTVPYPQLPEEFTEDKVGVNFFFYYNTRPEND